MSRRLAALCAVLLAAVLLAACGSTAHTRTITVPQKVTTEASPPSGLPLETSRTPEGAKQATPPVGLALAASVQKHISSAGLLLIERFEGFGSCPYWDPFGHVSTRGFGETDFGGNFGGRCITVAQGTINLRTSLENNYEWALRGLHTALNQNQWDALDSFVWNLGAGIFTGTTLGGELRARNFRGAANSMLQYVHAGGQVLAGLVTRRRAEVALFLKPDAQLTAAQVHAIRLRALRTQEGLRRAWHNDIEGHHCRKGQHTTPRFPLRLRHRYHNLLCPRWLRKGQHAITLINRYHREGVR